MKLVIKYVKKSKRKVIEASPEYTISELKQEIQEKFKICLNSFRLLLSIIPGVKVIMTDSFRLSFFGVANGSFLEIDEFRPISYEKKSKCKDSTYLDTLNIEIGYSFHEQTILDTLIDLIKKRNSELFISVSEKYIKEHPGEDILNQSHPNLWSSLHYACFYGNLEIVRYLALVKQVNVNRASVDQWTPLQLACFMEHVPCVQILLKHKRLQINKITVFRGSSLHLSCTKNNIFLVKLLLDNGAFAIIKDSQYLTPFDMTDNKEILKLLSEYAAKEELKIAEETKLEGMCSKLWYSRAFFIHDQQIILDLDIAKGFLHRYDIETYQSKGKPELSICLTDIQNVQEEINWFFTHKEEFYFTVETSKSSYRFYDRRIEPVKEWIKRIEKAVNYYLIHPKDLRSNPDHDLFQTKETSIDLSNANEVIVEGNLTAELFDFLGVLGEGSFGKIKKVKLKSTGEVYAMKKLSRKTLIKNKTLKYAISEIKIMRRLKHPYILPLIDSFENKDFIYILLEFCPNGDLAQMIKKRKKLENQEASFYISEIILALEYLHSRDIIYRDLKPANVLIDSDWHIKLADFGLAKEGVSEKDTANTFVGTPVYLPPEALIRGCTSKPADIYGLGVMMYEMLTGRPPFYNLNIQDLYHEILNSSIEFPDYIKDPAKEFITVTMNKNPDLRPNIHALRHLSLFYKRDWDGMFGRRIKPPTNVGYRTSLSGRFNKIMI